MSADQRICLFSFFRALSIQLRGVDKYSILFRSPPPCRSAEEQKQRMEKQNAASVKRTHIDFTGGKVKEKERDPSSTKKISRFQPYTSGGESRGKTRWG